MVGPHVERAKVAFDRAERELQLLDAVAFAMHAPADSRLHEEEVSHRYANWLQWVRMVGVQLDDAGKAAGRPGQFHRWWTSLLSNETHRFFWDQRNSAVKDVAVLIEPRTVEVQPGLVQAWWTFKDGPFAGDPIVPRCQQYLDWIYNEVYGTAATMLWPWPPHDIDYPAA